ncbi:fungal-specific transcription factor domain-containing protein, partial [Mycena maculata]
PHYVYPPSDLISSLLELYFTNIHPIIPVLHRPSFERSVADGLYLTDTKFGATLLAALAVASRYSNDPRVLIDGNKLSSGWKFVMQVQIVRSHFEVTIHEVQFYCLATLYWVGTSAPQVCSWAVGLGSRFLQHRGEHRRKREGYKSEHELWNRAFWSIFALDRMVCLFLGRPAAIHVEDYDVEPPLEVDDEYWEHGFTQPLGKPSMLSYFASILRLSEILGEALRRLYASKKLKTRMGWTGTEWEQGAVAELDSAMNDFFDSIPPHLRWDPNGPREGVFFDQSAILHGMYYHIQITIHRPFIHKQSPLAGPSLSICTTAARSALHVAAIWRMNRLQCLPFPWLQNSVFVSAVILLLNIFGSKRAGLPIDANRDLAQVGTALDILKFTETWCQPAGRLWELVQELQSLDGSLLGPPPNNGIRYGELGVMQPNRVLSDALPPTSMRSTGNFGPSQNSSRVNEVYAQSFDPGISIEQLLAETTTLDVSASTWTHSPAADGIPDDEIMSMWLAAPTDLT